MTSNTQYPGADIARSAANGDAATRRLPRARIIAVAPESPAYDAGFEPGCFITSVDGQAVRDIIDWRWLTGEESIVVGYVDLDGEEGEVELWREQGEEWGFEFEGLLFDDVKQCRNACTFCFMRQLPAGMRPSLSLRDDDFRLSFLVGTFITLTNLTPEDEARIIEQRISPLRVSLQASNPDVRRSLIGKHAQHGLDALDRLLAAGIQFHAQIVLVPGENDGSALEETLAWAYERLGILGIGIVPLGYTRHQTTFDHSFNDRNASQKVLDQIRPFQERAQQERNTPWVYAADEFYRNAHPNDLLPHIPPTTFYNDFAMFEDGIGIIRSTLDDWQKAQNEGTIHRCAEALQKANTAALLIAGHAQQEFLTPLIENAAITEVFHPLYVNNNFFGGNVDVTGLLTAKDITKAIKEQVSNSSSVVESEGASAGLSEAATSEGGAVSEDCLSPRSGRVLDRAPGKRASGSFSARSGELQLAPVQNSDSLLRRSEEREPQRAPQMSPRSPRPSGQQQNTLFLIPRVIFNDNGITLDGKNLQDMEKATGQTLHVVSCSPAEYFKEIIAILEDKEQ